MTDLTKIMAGLTKVDPPPYTDIVDVLVAVKDTRPDFAQKSLWSVHNQTYPLVGRLLVLDDGSTKKETVEFLDRAAASGWMNKLLRHEKNMGIGKSFNDLIRESTAPFVFIFGSDDLIFPSHIASVMAAMRERPEIDGLGTSLIVIDENDKFVRKWDIGGPPIYRRKLFEDGFWFDETLPRYVDSEHIERVTKAGRIIRYADSSTYYYRWHQENVTGRARDLKIIKTKMAMTKTKQAVAVIAPGCEFHGATATFLLGAKFYTEAQPLLDHDLIYCLGMFNPRLPQLFDTMANQGKTIILHWVGSDVPLWSDERVRMQLDVAKAAVDVHLCDSVGLQEELKPLDIEAEVLPIPPRRLPFIVPLPREPQVIAYVPEGREEFFHASLLEECESESGVKWVWLKGKTDYMDALKLMEESTVMVRYTQHDGGVPHSIGEMKMMGHYAIFNRELPFVTKALGKKQILSKIAELSKLPPEAVDQRGSKHYHDYFNHLKYASRFYEIIKSLLEKRGIKVNFDDVKEGSTSQA